ncbi:14421_t:CDS:2 [Gigaspora margarita]|uniref:14421_t:CDS:1 n=1 Tax=Gigaspora margarita TaxID=4874 RepID=A0ABN7VI45_GIGMA|nr:14421_t:CDS:2 [Gigaspora margarita]
MAPTSLEVQKNIKEYLKKCLKNIETKKKAQKYMILGDFNVDLNQIINLNLKEQAEKEEKKQIAQLLRGKRFADIFYEPNSPGQPTWKHKKAHSRIDTIWQLSSSCCAAGDRIKSAEKKPSRKLKKKTLKGYWKRECIDRYPRLSAIGKQNLRRAMRYYRE